MPSIEGLPEHQGGHQGEPDREREQQSYYQAARFEGEESAGRAYFQSQEAIFEDEKCDLSAYRLQLNRIWHVAVIGEQPGVETKQRIDAILSSGELTALPPEALKFLNARRAQTIKEGSWLEKHHRPGKRFGL